VRVSTGGAPRFPRTGGAMGFWENVKQFNERWNDLPRRGAIVLMVLLKIMTLIFPEKKDRGND